MYHSVMAIFSNQCQYLLSMANSSSMKILLLTICAYSCSLLLLFHAVVAVLIVSVLLFNVDCG